MGHTVKTLTEAELRDEIARITGLSAEEYDRLSGPAIAADARETPPKRKPGRPKGSRNKSKGE